MRYQSSRVTAHTSTTSLSRQPSAVSTVSPASPAVSTSLYACAPTASAASVTPTLVPPPTALSPTPTLASTSDNCNVDRGLSPEAALECEDDPEAAMDHDFGFSHNASFELPEYLPDVPHNDSEPQSRPAWSNDHAWYQMPAPVSWLRVIRHSIGIQALHQRIYPNNKPLEWLPTIFHSLFAAAAICNTLPPDWVSHLNNLCTKID
jgi:hypothetical protein